MMLPEHGDRPFDLDRYRGVGKGVWGSTQAEIDRHLQDARDEWDREPPD
ncbi:MAG: hypothetical protein K9G24_03515 [Candidatus Nanopelagicales bacterium]|nr:hypothetical protein [Candidatus Nanopelagicales bacterium]MCF8537190.1 hypothetical protein [Candidatus Nanopelagicales bacterium]MCF8542130.1 hypothetical protein [Candidatus Nanopelagicales bacterium]MCF8556421.1 hypothetical protein [Candidatus Nanopelagicales bacterium]